VRFWWLLLLLLLLALGIFVLYGFSAVFVGCTFGSVFEETQCCLVGSTFGSVFEEIQILITI